LHGKVTEGSGEKEVGGAREAACRPWSLRLLCRNESDLTGDALPGLALSDPGVDEASTLGEAFSFLGFSDAKNANRTAVSA
jgi:hypothetical protein